MKKFSMFFAVVGCMLPMLADAAIAVKKGSSVSKKEETKVESATSLLPTVLNVVQGVKTLRSQTQTLNSQCKPSSEDIRIVNELVKEWAKSGDATADSAVYGLGDTKCSTGGYTGFMQTADKGQSCYEVFESTSDKGRVWENFPKATVAEVCSAGGNSKKKDCHSVSNIYTIFDKIPFSDADYTKSEAQQVAKLRKKSEECAPSKVLAAKAGLVTDLVQGTISNVGKSSNVSGTEAVLQMVSGLDGSGIQSMLPMLQTVGTQMMDK